MPSMDYTQAPWIFKHTYPDLVLIALLDFYQLNVIKI